MKKIKYIVFALILSIIFIPNVSAKNVEIKSITEVDKSENTVIKSTPTYNGLEMNFDVAFKEKDDFVKYKVVIKNDTNTEYKISNDTSFNKSEYITYNYEISENLKPKGETTVFVTIKYNKEVDSSLLVDGKYNEENKAVIQLLDKEGTPANPNTGQKIIIMIILISLIILLTTILIIKKKNKLFSLIIISLLLIPTIVYAVETLKLTINTNVEIKQSYNVGYVISTPGVFTDEEINKYNINRNMCTKTYYLEEMIENNKYTFCSTTLTTNDEKKYFTGETVELKDFTVKRLTTRITTNGITINYCEEISPNTYLCSNEATLSTDTINYWEYAIGSRTYNPLGLESDKQVMNFSNISYDYWDTDKYFCVTAPQTFTMPAHDVNFFINNYGQA